MADPAAIPIPLDTMLGNQPAPGSTDDGLPTPQRYWAATAIWLAMAMTVIDSAIANVALPTIGHDLGASPASSIWVVSAYQIAITMVLLPAAALGEIVGYRRVYMAGLGVFIVASFGCVLSPDLGSLALSRFIQGFGAAAVMGINGALVRFTYPKAMLGRGIGYNALVVAISSAAGPSVAAAILAVAPWRWLFAVNVPLGLLALVIGQRCLPRTPRTAKRLDIPSALLNALTFGALFLGFSDLAQGGAWLRMTAELAVGLVAGTVLVRRSQTQASPLVPVDLLRIPLLRLSYATSSVSFAAQMVALVSLPFYLQGRFGLDHVQTGLLMTPWPLGVAVAAPLAGRLVERVSSGLLGGIGLGILAVGLCLLGTLPADASFAAIVVRMVICGAGFGLFQTPNNRTMLGIAPRERSGAAAGMLATARLVGQTAGGVMVALLFRAALPTSPMALFIGAGLAAGAAVISMRRLKRA